MTASTNTLAFAKTRKPTKQEVHEAIRVILRWIGEVPEREGLVETPRRVVQSYQELYSGYQQDPIAVLEKTFTNVSDYDDMVLVKDIDLESYCEHHMLPILGKAHVAYIPNQRIVGLSKLARVTEIYAKRLQTQEQLTMQIANAIETVLQPKGVAVIIDATHLCMSMRGIHKIRSSTRTQAYFGLFKADKTLKQNMLDAIR